jgi:hypothetical protein
MNETGSSKPTSPTLSYYLWRLLFLLILVTFIILSLQRIDQPLAQDELHWFVAAKSASEGGIPRQYGSPSKIAAYSPHFYLSAVTSAFRLFGVSEQTARIPGIVSGLVTLFLLFRIIPDFSSGDREQSVRMAIVLSALYAFTPATIQGTTIIDIDNTILIPATLFLTWSFAKFLQDPKLWKFWLPLAVMIALWARVTTPGVLILFYILISLIHQKGMRAKLTPVGFLLTGGVLFLVTWFLYCRFAGVPFLDPFLYTIKAFQQKGLGSSENPRFKFLQNFLSLTLWMGFFFFLLTLEVIRRRIAMLIKDCRFQPEDVFLWAGVILLAGYTLLGGAIFGFPKYQTPALPLICISAGAALSRSTDPAGGPNFKALLLLASVAFCVYFFVAPDLLFTLRYRIREAVALGSPDLMEMVKATLSRVALLAFAFAVVALAGWFIAFRKRGLLLLLAIAIGSNLAASCQQNRSGYSTGYNYGGTGTRETARQIRQKVPALSRVIAPSEIIYYLNLPESFHIGNALWTDPKRLVDLLLDEKTSALAYSLATNAVSQVQLLSQNKHLQEILRSHFELPNFISSNQPQPVTIHSGAWGYRSGPGEDILGIAFGRSLGPFDRTPAS